MKFKIEIMKSKGEKLMNEEITNIWNELPEDYYPEIKIYTANQWEENTN